MMEMNQELLLSNQEVSASKKWIEGDHNIHWHDFYEMEYILSRSLMDCEERGQNGMARKMQFYIINHFREKVTLEDVAKYAGLTLAYASAVFKKEMDTNFKKYLNELRFSYAKKLLMCSDLSVTQICGECGFEDYPNFIRRFREHFGMTPSQVRGIKE